MKSFRYKVKVRLNYLAPDSVLLSEFDAICKDASIKGMLDKKATIEFDLNGKMYWVLPNQEKILANSSFYLFFNFLDIDANSNKYQLIVGKGVLENIIITTKNGYSTSVPFDFENTVFDGVCIKDMKEEDRSEILKLKKPDIVDHLVDLRKENTKDFTIKSLADVIASNLNTSVSELPLAPIEDKIIIEYVAIHITSRDNRTLHSEFSMHQPNRHESLRDHIKKMTGKKPSELGDVEEGFRTDEGVFLTRREAMNLYRKGKLCNRVKFTYGKPDDMDMQSIYLW